MKQIRTARLDDAPALVDLTHQLGYPIPLPTLAEHIKIYLEDGEKALFVATIEEKIIGYIALDLAQTFHREGKHMRVVSLVIDQLHRGSGTGTLLLQTAESWAREQGCWVIEITSSSRRQKEGTHDFYLKQAYLKDGTQAYFHKLLDI